MQNNTETHTSSTTHVRYVCTADSSWPIHSTPWSPFEYSKHRSGLYPNWQMLKYPLLRKVYCFFLPSEERKLKVVLYNVVFSMSEVKGLTQQSLHLFRVSTFTQVVFHLCHYLRNHHSSRMTHALLPPMRLSCATVRYDLRCCFKLPL